MSKQINGLTLLLLSIPPLYWSTNMQEQCFTGGYFTHYIGGGSVCKFGQHVGIAIILSVLIEFSLLLYYFKNNDIINLNKVIITFICINAFLMLGMLMANSGVQHYLSGYGFVTGLFERSLPYFILQFTGLALIYSK